MNPTKREIIRDAVILEMVYHNLPTDNKTVLLFLEELEKTWSKNPNEHPNKIWWILALKIEINVRKIKAMMFKIAKMETP